MALQRKISSLAFAQERLQVREAKWAVLAKWAASRRHRLFRSRCALVANVIVRCLVFPPRRSACKNASRGAWQGHLQRRVPQRGERAATVTVTVPGAGAADQVAGRPPTGCTAVQGALEARRSLVTGLARCIVHRRWAIAMGGPAGLSLVLLQHCSHRSTNNGQHTRGGSRRGSTAYRLCSMFRCTA